MVRINSEKCKACGYCVAACPKGALAFGEKVNGKGYHAVTVDEDNCVSCGTSYTVCPDTVFIIEEG